MTPSPTTSTPLVLGIKTSCDETGVGIVHGTELLFDAIASSVDEHARFGGVVPEVASRAHLEAMVPTVHRALADAGCDLAQGFLFARPMWAEDVVAWVTARDGADAQADIRLRVVGDHVLNDAELPYAWSAGKR